MSSPSIPKLMADVRDLVSLQQYRQGREHLFPSEGSLTWYCRIHSSALVASNAMVKHRGRWAVHPGCFDQFVMRSASIAARAAQSQLSLSV